MRKGGGSAVYEGRVVSSDKRSREGERERRQPAVQLSCWLQDGPAVVPCFSMASLERVNSFDLRLQSLTSPQTLAREASDYAVRVLQLWLLRRLRLSRVRAALTARKPELLTVLQRLRGTPLQSFDATTAALTDPVFAEALSSVLTSLPVDPVLRNRNAMARSARFISSAVLVRLHPSEMLTASHGTSLDAFAEDASEEAKLCKNAATMVCSGLASLISSVLEDQPLRLFRARFIGFRFAVRYYVESMSAWKRLDADRMVAALQATFVEVYGVLNSLETSLRQGSISDEVYQRNQQLAIQQFARIELELTQLLGSNSKARGVIEELKAYCEAMHAHGALTSQTSVTLRREANEQSKVENELTSPPGLIEELVAAAKHYADFNFTEEETQLVNSLKSVTDTPLDVIIYEVCVSDKYALSNESPRPEFKLFEYSNEGSFSQNAKDFLRCRFLQILGDRLISSLTPSSVENTQQVLDDPAPEVLTRYIRYPSEMSLR